MKKGALIKIGCQFWQYRVSMVNLAALNISRLKDDHNIIKFDFPLPPLAMNRKLHTLFSLLTGIIFSSAFILFTSTRADAQMRQLYQDIVAENKISKISFYSASEGYVAFRDWIGFTTDSGRTFTKKFISIGNVNYNGYSVNITFGFGIAGVKAFNQNTIIAYGDYGLVPAILYSNNGGSSFTLVYHSQYNSQQLSGGITDVEFPQNNNIGYAVDADRILKTTNGGLSWSVARTDPNSYFTHLQGIDNNTVFTHSLYTHKILRTTNAGASWQSVPVPSIPSGTAAYPYFLTATKGWVSIYDDNSNDYFYTTSDGGISWTLLNDPVATPFVGLEAKFVDDNVGYAIGGLFTIYKTEDGGRIWEPLPRDNNYEYLYFYHFDLYFLNNNQFWAGGGHGFLEMTTNGGGTTLPKAYFKIDTTNLSVTQVVNLSNYSKQTYQYKWYKNNVLISTSYNASYTYVANNPLDSIKLVVSDGIHSDSVTKYQYFNVTPPPPPPPPYTGWQIKPTNIDDNLSDCRIYGNYGILTGNKGIYYTTTGIASAAGWQKFVITTSSTDSLLLVRTKFSQIDFDEQSYTFFACGNDTVNNKAILFRINPATLSYAFLYTGAAGTRFNAMTIINVNSGSPTLQIVGDNGLHIKYVIPTNTLLTYTVPGNKKLIDVYSRSFTAFPEAVGIISDSIVYIGGTNTPVYTNNTGRKIIHAAGIGGAKDFLISESKLYQTFSGSGYFRLDSFTRIKAPAIQFNAIAHGNVGSHMYIGTNRGIYKVYYSSNPSVIAMGTETIEYQPSSAGKYINNIWFKERSVFDTGYAVGPNGLLMQAVSFADPTVPYSEILSGGNCLGSATSLTGQHGTGTTCKWYVDNVLSKTNCEATSTTISTAGAHSIKYIVSNVYGFADTSVKTIYVSPVPLINLPVTVDDTVLCKSQSVVVAIQNTQAGYKYELIQDSTGNSFGSINSNTGGQVFLGSSPISQSGYYHIRVTNVQGGCAKNFTNKIFIKVEHTKSYFMASKINAGTNEELGFYQHSVEAQSFLWKFNEDASIASSGVANPQNISYPSMGQKTISLISTSAYGCSDTLINSAAVFVYNKPMPDDVCYVSGLSGNSTSQIFNQLSPAKDKGFLITAYGNKPLIKSRYGVSIQLMRDGTSYIAKYTTDGILSWAGWSANGSINGSTTDKDGNIYVIGTCSTKGYFIFANGDSMRLTNTPADTISYTSSTNGFILKLDSAGHYLWHTVIDDPSSQFAGYPVSGGNPTRIKIEGTHIIVSGTFLANLAYYRNGITQNLVALPNSTYANDLQNNFILKIKSDGTLLWNMYFQNSATNQRRAISGIGIDGDGNSYVTGYYENKLTVHDADNLNTFIYTGQVGDAHSFLFKFDSLGHLRWKVNMKNTFFFRDVLMYDIATDQNGNSYLTGAASLLDSVTYFQITNSNGTTSNVSLSRYCVLKFDSSGMYRWSAGSRYSYYGQGTCVYLKDNDLYAAGMLYNNGPTVSTFTFTSTNNNNVTVPVYISELFVANYDTAGVLKRFVKSGNNNYGYINIGNFTSDGNGNFIIGGNTDITDNGNGSPSMFNSPINVPAAGDGFFGKLNFDFCYAGPPAADSQTCINGSISFNAGIAGTNFQWQYNTGNGFVNISNDAYFSGSATNTLHITTIPAAWYGYQFRCIVDGNIGNVMQIAFRNTWTGAVDVQWENPANWSCGIVPDSNTDVVINAGTIVLNTSTTIRTLTVTPGVNLTVTTGNTLTVTH